MKRFIAILMVIISMISFSGCKKKPENNDIGYTDKSIAAGSETSTEETVVPENNETVDTDESTSEESEISTDIVAEDTLQDEEFYIDTSDGQEKIVYTNDSEQNTSDGQESSDSQQTATDIPKTNSYDPSAYKPLSECTDEDFIITKDIDFEGLEFVTSAFVDYIPSNETFDEFLQSVSDQNGIVIRGKKSGNSTQYSTENNDHWYSEAPIEVLEVYQGDVKAGDTILMSEEAVVMETNSGEKYIRGENDDYPISNNTEYVLILIPSSVYSRNGRSVYSVADWNKAKHEITEQVKEAVLAGEYSESLNFSKIIFERFLLKK